MNILALIVTCKFLKTSGLNLTRTRIITDLYRVIISYLERNDYHDDKNKMMGWKKYIFWWNWYILYSKLHDNVPLVHYFGRGDNGDAYFKIILREDRYEHTNRYERSSWNVLVDTLFSFHDKHCSQSVSSFRLQITWRSHGPIFRSVWFGRKYTYILLVRDLVVPNYIPSWIWVLWPIYP